MRYHPGFLSEQEWHRITASYRLSVQEAEVAACILENQSIGEVSRLLSISPNTVRTYIKRVYAKAGVRSRYDLLLLTITTSRSGVDRDSKPA
jgi:DNA-binding CsgD family transcriptional regulator